MQKNSIWSEGDTHGGVHNVDESLKPLYKTWGYSSVPVHNFPEALLRCFPECPSGNFGLRDPMGLAGDEVTAR